MGRLTQYAALDAPQHIVKRLMVTALLGAGQH
jgi:hypothetical protein